MQVLDNNIVGQLKTLDESQPGFFKQILEVYETTCQESLQAMQAAKQERDIQALRSKAHALKGSSANIGAARLSNMCKDIVTACDKGEAPDLSQLQTEIQSSVAELKQRV